jgi:peptide/nickel transport system substrate-binding protein
MGVRSPAVDALIDHLIKTQARADVVAAARALDRVLISGFYVVPLFYPPEHWVARWSTLAHPTETSLMGYLPEAWWIMAK